MKISFRAAAKNVFLAAVFIICIGNTGIRCRAYSEVLAEGQTGTVLIEEKGDKQYPCGSLSKLMTVNIAAEEIKSGRLALTDEVIVSEHANTMQGAQIWLMPGDRITVEELLKAVVIGNANDAACALAEHIGGTEEAFTAIMNSRAAELGMTSTLYKNASGYQSSGDKTSAADTAKLLCSLCKHSFLKDIFTQRMEYICGDKVQLVTSNPKAVRYGGALGFKAGFYENRKGKKVYFSAEGAERDGDIYVSAVLGCTDEGECAEEAFALLDRGFAEYETHSLEAPLDMPRKIRVKGGRIAEAGITAGKLGKAVIPRGTSGKITCRTALPEYIYAPVKKDDTAGQLLYYYNDRFIGAADITVTRTSDKKNIKYGMVKMLKNIIKF